MLNSQKRIESIDTFRGLTIFLMIFVIAVAAGGYRDLPQKTSWFNSLPVSAWNHADVAWEQFVHKKLDQGYSLQAIEKMPGAKRKDIGCTLTDLVAPFFVFIVGLVIPLSRSRHGKLWWHRVFRRTLHLILAGILYISLILGLSWWWGILQTIGIAYLMGALSLRLPQRGRWIALFSVLAFHTVMSHTTHWWLHFGETAEPFFRISNLNGSMAKPLTVHCLPWVSISYGAMTIAGVILGEIISTADRNKIMRSFFLVGMGLSLAGYGIHKIGIITQTCSLCFNKPDVTASYALFASGIAALTFLLIYYIQDVRGWRRWAWPLKVLGMNALLAYFMQVVMRIFFRALHIEAFFSSDPNAILQQWAGLFQSSLWQSFLLDKSGYNGMLWGFIWSASLWLIIYGCNKRNIFWKL
ncbi:DUF1624 domain-containing protein [candidate division KSB1 bacterium]|nr:DUF1624 domain-containing protein [candidate division KSB1 bacterium]